MSCYRQYFWHWPQRMREDKKWRRSRQEPLTCQLRFSETLILSGGNLSCRSAEKSPSETERNPLGATKKYNGQERKIGNKGWEKSSQAELAEIWGLRERAQRVTVRDEVVPLSTCALSKSEIQPYRLSPTEWKLCPNPGGEIWDFSGRNRRSRYNNSGLQDAWGRSR